MHCHTCKSSKDDLIYESDYWIVLLHKSQGYIGRCMIDLKRHAESLSDLTKDEWEDFISLIKKLEAALKKSFMATTFNLTFMMNDAFQEKPYNPHVHWHLRARYRNQFSDKFAVARQLPLAALSLINRFYSVITAV